MIVAAIDDIGRARGMTEIATCAEVSREVMYKSCRVGGNPTMSTLSRVVKALGYRVTFERAKEKTAGAAWVSAAFDAIGALRMSGHEIVPRGKDIFV